MILTHFILRTKKIEIRANILLEMSFNEDFFQLVSHDILIPLDQDFFKDKHNSTMANYFGTTKKYRMNVLNISHF